MALSSKTKSSSCEAKCLFILWILYPSITIQYLSLTIANDFHNKNKCEGANGQHTKTHHHVVQCVVEADILYISIEHNVTIFHKLNKF